MKVREALADRVNVAMDEIMKHVHAFDNAHLTLADMALLVRTTVSNNIDQSFDMGFQLGVEAGAMADEEDTGVPEWDVLLDMEITTSSEEDEEDEEDDE